MKIKIVKCSITNIQVDIIVNASNGIGYMGGKLGLIKELPGVAESIHYRTKGAVEIEAKESCKKIKWLPRWLGGSLPGDVFVTAAGSLKIPYIIHAVTMRYPGQKSKLSIIKALLPKIEEKAIELGARTIAIPLLGTGKGGLDTKEVLKIYTEYFETRESPLEIIVCTIKNI